jgi:predicted naringenin-chalcone synthase
LRSARIEAIGLANPPHPFSQDEAFRIASYTSSRILEIFRNCDIDFRHFYVAPGQSRKETPAELNNRYLNSAIETGCRAVAPCLQLGQSKVTDIDLLVLCTSTGYVCPDLGSRLIAHMGFRRDIHRAVIVGLGCAGAPPTLQRACDFVRAHPKRTALLLAVEICSACYFVDDTMDTVVGNAICADGAAAFLISGKPENRGLKPSVLDCESCVDSEHIDKIGFEHRDGRLRIILSNVHKEVELDDVEQRFVRLPLEQLRDGGRRWCFHRHDTGHSSKSPRVLRIHVGDEGSGDGGQGAAPSLSQSAGHRFFR